MEGIAAKILTQRYEKKGENYYLVKSFFRGENIVRMCFRSKWQKLGFLFANRLTLFELIRKIDKFRFDFLTLLFGLIDFYGGYELLI